MYKANYQTHFHYRASNLNPKKHGIQKKILKGHIPILPSHQTGKIIINQHRLTTAFKICIELKNNGVITKLEVQRMRKILTRLEKLSKTLLTLWLKCILSFLRKKMRQMLKLFQRKKYPQSRTKKQKKQALLKFIMPQVVFITLLLYFPILHLQLTKTMISKAIRLTC